MNRIFDVFELLRVIIKNRIAIAFVVLGVSIAGVAYSFLAHQIWQSTASFYTISNSSKKLSLSKTGLAGIGGDILEAQRDSDSFKSLAIMQSNSFTEDVIRKFNLTKYFGLSDTDSLVNMDNALVMMEDVVTFEYGIRTSMISVTVETKDKDLSARMAAYYMHSLDRYNRENRITQGKRNRIFLEERVTQLRTQIDSLLVLNRSFQEQYKVVDIQAQSEELIQSYTTLVSEKMKLDIQIEIARNSYAANSPLLKSLETQRKELQRQIREMENKESSLKPEYLLNLSSIPDIGEQAAQLKLSLNIAQQLYEYLYPQYEDAVQEELRDMPTLEVIDSPRSAGVRVRPRRAMICIISFCVSVFLGILYAIIKESIVNSKDRMEVLREAFDEKHDHKA